LNFRLLANSVRDNFIKNDIFDIHLRQKSKLRSRYKLKEININIDSKLIDYIKYLKDANVINIKYGLDSIQIKVLIEILFVLSKYKAITVGDVLIFTHVASRVTSRNFKLLVNNMVSFRLVNKSPTKFFVITSLGEKSCQEYAKNAFIE
jgi:hypothetical protein